MSQSQTEYDVIVVGSGAGGMTAALYCHLNGLSALVIEKADVYGGTTAVSGGGVWIPGNHQMEGLGCSDNDEDARAYLHHLTQGEVDHKRLEAYIQNAREMILDLEKHHDVKFESVVKYPDYFQKAPGSRPGFRTMEPATFDAAKLGDVFDKQRHSYSSTLFLNRIAMGQAEAHTLLTKQPGWLLLVFKLLLGYWLDFGWRRKTRRDRKQKLGQGLVASLRTALLKQDIPLWLNTAFEDLVEEEGRVTGVRVVCDGQTQTLTARRGVILACGGFESNQAMREKYLPTPTDKKWSATPNCNHGEGIEAGQRIGAATKFMNLTWGTPTVVIPGATSATGTFVERACPGGMMVNGLGQRFCNEAGPYTEVIYSVYEDHAKTGATLPCWFIADARFRKNYPMGPILPSQIMPDGKLPSAWEGTVYHKANTIDELAEKAGIDAEGLKATIARNNEFAIKGVDEDFGKGDNIFDTYYGDESVKPNPCLAELKQAPFYAVRFEGGELGTKGGLDADEAARVMREDGSVIPGLYAIGNCSAATMGRSYPGPGSTLGPAMTFGYLAAKDLAETGEATEPVSNAA